MRETILTVAIAAMISMGVGNPPCNEFSSAIQAPSDSSTDRIFEVLDQDVAMSYDQIPFAEILDELRQSYRINVYLDESAIDDALSEDELVTFEANETKLQFALKMMLSCFNATYIVRDDVLLIISKDVAKDPAYLVRKIINCKTLLTKISNAGQGREDKLLGVLRIEDAATEKLFFEQVIDDSNNDDNEKANPDSEGKTLTIIQSRSDAEPQLLDAIKISVTPDDWNETNGNGSVIIVGNCLIIHQTSDAIHQVESLFKELSEVMDQE